MKYFKKISACCIAIAMMFTLCISAFAEGATLTVHGNQLTGKPVTAVRMFNATFIDKNTNGNVDGQIDSDEQVGYTLETAWQPFFNGLGATTSDAAYAYVAALDADGITSFALSAKNYYNAHQSDFASLTKTSANAANDTAVITDLPTGYYLVLPASGSTSTARHHDAILVNVPSNQSNPRVDLKSEYPTVEKTADGAATTAAQIGDTVTFTLTSTVPDMSEYDTYQFAFKDTMSNGLTFVDGSLTVKVGEKNVKNDATHGYQFTRNGQNLTVSFANLNDENTELADDTKIVAGNVITVTYQAKINANAVIDGAGNPNTATVEYSNDPSDATGATKGVSLQVRSTVYVYSIVIHKYHDEDIAANRLAGAVFELYRGSESTPIQLVTTGTDIYRVATAEEIADNTVTKLTSVTTPASGIVTINGLDSGVYHLKETQAPSGYNKLGSPVDITISATGTDYSTPTFAIGTAAATTSNIIAIENNDGTMLPFTGGTGTIIATAIGVCAVLGGVYVLFFAKKKEDKAETSEKSE